MFCPVCRAEYRQGFTRCADCDVELVWELPVKAIVPHAADAPGDSDEDPFCSFWTGDDPRIHAEICELLEKEGIPHKTVRREDHLFHISNFPAFQIGIPFSMFERGEAAVKEAYGSEEPIEPASRLLPMETEQIPGTRSSRWNSESTEGTRTDDSPEDSIEPRDSMASASGGDAENWEGKDAGAEIWSGDEPETAEFISASLQINEIQFRHSSAGGKHRIYVQPGDETRAREIVREVVEGVPPE